MPHKLFSIESRKGGVGKTTVALNLASILVKRGPVLLLDCDLTGTSIIDPAKNSSFWSSETNVLKYVDNKRDVKDINLIEYFLETFIKGEGSVRDFIKQGKLIKNKVNVLGSSLYGTSKEAAINSSWLFEELHSYWFVEFVQQIIVEFEGLYPDVTVFIIIDNSPGYTTFSQALHNYMFEEGPNNAKFLLVSTLDSQDLLANIEAAAEIDKDIQNRTIAAKYFQLKERDEKGANSDANAEALIETDGEIKDFFFQLIDNNQLLEVYTKEYNTADYLALLLNKIPQSLQDNNTRFAYEDIVGDRLLFLSRIAGSDGRSEPKNVVYYDEAIVYQYYINYLRGRTDPRSGKAGYWPRRLREIGLQVEEASQLSPMEEMTKLSSCFLGLQSSLTQHGHAQIARQFEESWTPNYAIDALKETLSKVTSKLSFSSEIPPLRIKEILHQWNEEQLKVFPENYGMSDAVSIVLSDLINYLESFAGLRDQKRRPEQMVAVSLLVYLFSQLLLQRKEKDLPLELSLKEYFHHPYILRLENLVDVKKGIVVNLELTLEGVWLERLVRRSFDSCFSLFIYSILRLLEQNEDFRLILAAVGLYVPSEMALSFSKEMTRFISDVVVRKSRNRDYDQLAEIRARTFVMKNMQDVLRENVLKQWK